MIVGFTDAPFFREKGAVAYGFGLFSRTLTAEAMPAASTATTSASTSNPWPSPPRPGSRCASSSSRK